MTNFYSSKPDGDLAIYYELNAAESASTRGIVEMCPFSNRISKFFEKPQPNETTSRNASVVFFCLRSTTVDKIEP